jgi:hypothetical protein
MRKAERRNSLILIGKHGQAGDEVNQPLSYDIKGIPLRMMSVLSPT